MAEGRTCSGRHVLCLGFLLFLISATALAISIVALVKTMNNDKDIETNEKSVVEKQQITSTTAGHRGQTIISTSDYSRQHVISTTSSRQHESSSDDDRTDSLVGCHNRGIENKATCEKMGCIWRETAPGKKQPSCVFDDEAGYSVTGKIQRNGNKYTATLRKKSLRRIYGMEIFDNVQMVVDTYHDSALRIYIKGGPSPFEIPDEALHMNRPTGSRNLQYNVSFVTDPYFGIIVTRISTGAVIFNTTLPGLILSEQFVQISTKLPSDNLYGFGEHNHRRYKHDMNWRTWPIFTRDVAPVDDWNLYGAYPVYMNLENDGKANMVFLRNSHAMDVVLQPYPYPAITYKVIGGVLDFYVFLGPSPQEAIQQFTYAVGRPMMPPYWSLGFHLSRWGYQNLTHMETVVDRTRAAGIPQDVQWGDIDYMYKKFVFTRNRQTFQDLPQFVGKLHQRGQKFVIIVDPGVGSNKTLYKEAKQNSPGYRVYDDGLERDVFVKTANGSVLEGEVWPGLTVYPDFTHPNVTDWLVKWINFFQSNESIQVDGLWVDMNEPSNFKPGSTTGCSRNKWNHPPYVPQILEGDKDNGSLYYKTLCMDAQQHWGKEYSVHSLYGHSNCIAAHKALTQILPGKRPFIMTRSSFVGTSKYAAHWSGDNQSQWRQLPWSIVWMLEFSMFGFSMLGADICGFYFETNYELCLRWMQVGAFYPFSRNHNAMGFRDQDPANWDEAFSYIAKDIIRTRYRILPYMYTLLYDAHISGKTVTGALMWEFPHDKNTWSVDRQFLLGPALLITPVLEEGKRSVEGYFPDARWFSYYDGEEIKHPGNNVTFDTPLNQINVHLRGGYILPVQEPDMTTAESRKRDLGLLVSFDRSYTASGHLFWDDGESSDSIGSGNFLMLHFNASSGNSLNINVINNKYPEAATLKLGTVEVYGLSTFPTKVTVDHNTTDNSQIRYKSQILQIVGLSLSIVHNHTLSWE